MDLNERAERYDVVAKELEVAAAHARTAAMHCRNQERVRAPAHAFSVVGHIRRAQDELDGLARLHAEKSVPVSEY